MRAPGPEFLELSHAPSGAAREFLAALGAQGRTTGRGGTGAGSAHRGRGQSRRAVAGRGGQLDRRRPGRDRTGLVSVCWPSIPAGLRPRSATRARRAGVLANGCKSRSTCRPARTPTASSWSRAFCRRASSRRRRRIRQIAAELVEPLSSAETTLLAALAPLAAHSPRDAKRFLNAYRLARCSNSPRPVTALMQAVAFADDDAQAAMLERLADGSGELTESAVRPRWSKPSRRRAPPTTVRYRSRRRAPRRKSPSATPCRSKRRPRLTRLRRLSARRRGADNSGATGPLSHLPKLSR